MTALTIISASMRLIGALGSGQTPSTEETTDGLEALQNLLADWSSDELLMFATRTASVTMVLGQASYAIPGARPVKILSADLVYASVNTPVEVCGADRWAAIPDKDLTGPQSKYVYCDYAYPTPAILVASVPSATAVMRLYCTVDLATVAASGSTFDMPEGYARAVIFNLAVDRYGEFPRAGGLNPTVAKGAIESKAELRKMLAANRAGKSELELPPMAPA